jgi:mycoredoxin
VTSKKTNSERPTSRAPELPAEPPDLITVYGADWCEDTQRSLRLLRRLHVPYRYLNVDDDLDALARAKELNSGKRRTPTIDLGLGGRALVEPSNDTLTGALVEMAMLTRDEAYMRMAVQNVGDTERGLRAAAGLAILAAGSSAPRGARWPFVVLGFLVTATGVTGWCPAYHYAGVTSLGGPGDRLHEAERDSWLAPRPAAAAPSGAVASDL